MIEEYKKYLININENAFTIAPKKAIKILNKLVGKKYTLPKEFMNIYTNVYPLDDIEICEDIIIYPIERLVEENKDYVPGCVLINYGLLTFGSTSDGDAIVIDLNDSNNKIYQFSHSILDSDDEISFYTKNKGMVELTVDYNTIISCAVKLADNINDFILKIIEQEMYTYDVITEVIERFENN